MTTCSALVGKEEVRLFQTSVENEKEIDFYFVSIISGDQLVELIVASYSSFIALILVLTSYVGGHDNSTNKAARMGSGSFCFET